MSLWHKPISNITFEDIDTFCQTMQPEGTRLDYKVERPSDLAKLIAAFANTLGGLIILGVDADKSTNQPVWPPLKGMPSKPGIDEAITSIARDAIYPPVRVNISPIIENSRLPGHFLVVVRVDESRDAPHAIEDGRKIYERTGSTNKPHDLARIDRIEYLLGRRRKIEEEREDIRSRAVARSLRLIPEDLKPIMWLSVIPVYPWKDICKPSICHNHFWRSTFPTQGVQRIPDGGIFINEINLPPIGKCAVDVISCDSKGHFLYARGLVGIAQLTFGTYSIYREDEFSDRLFLYDSVKERLSKMLAAAREFYEKPEVERPGMLSVKIGMIHTQNVRFYRSNNCGFGNFPKPFLDDAYHQDSIMTIEEFLSLDGKVNDIFDRMAFAFDVSTPDGQ